MIRYFRPEEFKCCTPSCTVADMDMSFLSTLDSARALSGVPFVLLSAYRSSEHDIARGRSGKGYHTLGRAVDVKCVDGKTRWRIIHACLTLSLSVGIYPTFLHIDNRSNCVIFYGK